MSRSDIIVLAIGGLGVAHITRERLATITVTDCENSRTLYFDALFMGWDDR